MIIDRPEAKDIPCLRTLWTEAFGDGDSFLDVFFTTAFSRDRCRCVFLDGKPIAALYWFDCAYHNTPVAYLYAVATAEAHRGKGVCSALMEDTHRHLKALGYKGAILVPSEKGLFKFYEMQGYLTCGRIKEFKRKASLDSVELRRITVEEYARLRRALLPDNGIIQEKENLALLNSQAELYGGKDFVLAARRENDILYGIELLGDISLASAITGSLGCAEGSFRTAVKDSDKDTKGIRPFAMCRPLADANPPSDIYFGLAFD